MRLLNRTTLPTLAVIVGLVALVSGLVVSSVRSHHHKSAKAPVTSHVQQVPLAQRESVAHQLSTQTLPKGLTHTTVCPSTATDTDACFAAPLASPATSALVAATDAEKMLTSLGLTLDIGRSCNLVTGGPMGAGFTCIANGLWRGYAVGTNVFVSSQSTRPAGTPGLDAIVSVLASKP